MINIIKFSSASSYLLLPLTTEYFPRCPVLKHPQSVFVPYSGKPSFTPVPNNKFMRSEVFIVATLKIAVFLHITPCSLVEVYSFFFMNVLHLHGRKVSQESSMHSILSTLKMEAICSFVISINFYQATEHHMPVDSIRYLPL
jgi:hypothetical protein